MYPVSENYAKKIIANDRVFSVRLTFGSSRVLTGTTIQNITLDEIVNSTDALTIGCACSHKITINLINAPTDIDYSNSNFTAEVGLLVEDRPITYEWIPLGEFYVADAETSNDFKDLTITAYDGFSKMTDKYNATVEENTTLQAVYDDLRTQLYENCGIVLKERVLPDYSIEHFPYLDITYTQAVGYVAGCLGEFARFDRTGELELVSYTNSGIVIGRDMQYMNGFKRITEKPLIITSVSTGTSDNTIIRSNGANGTTISFENPYITDTMADSVYAEYNSFIYTPCQVKWRGNPAIQAGDIVSVISKDGKEYKLHTVLVMSQNIKIGGGLNATIDCKGKSDTTSKFSSNFEPTGQKLDRIYKTLEQKILDATNAITGNKGGYVKLLDTNNDGSPDEIVISDLPILESDNPDTQTATKVWRWNKEGLGYAHREAGNAYKLGSYATAIMADGQINADFITTGTLNAERIAVNSYDNKTGLLTDYIHFENGVMTFGEGESELKLKLENEEIAFYRKETKIGWFSPNSFELENLTGGKVRFQNFGFIPRKSKNLTFTLLT